MPFSRALTAPVLALAGGLALVLQPVLSSTAAVAQNAEEHVAAGEPGDPDKPFRVIEVSMTESGGKMAFVPAAVEVRNGEQIKFVLTNTGELDHEFRLDSAEHNAAHKITMENPPISYGSTGANPEVRMAFDDGRPQVRCEQVARACWAKAQPD